MNNMLDSWSEFDKTMLDLGVVAPPAVQQNIYT